MAPYPTAHISMELGPVAQEIPGYDADSAPPGYHDVVQESRPKTPLTRDPRKSRKKKIILIFVGLVLFIVAATIAGIA